MGGTWKKEWPDDRKPSEGGPIYGGGTLDYVWPKKRPCGGKEKPSQGIF